jgi:hypothetical protein
MHNLHKTRWKNQEKILKKNQENILSDLAVHNLCEIFELQG